MKAIVVDSEISDGLDFSIQKKIFEKAGITYVMENCASEQEVIDRCSDADALLNIFQPITPRIMDSCPNLKVCLRFGIGYDSIDVEAATQRGIYVCNSPTHCLDEVATHTMALILAMERKIVRYNDALREGKWILNPGPKPHRLSVQTLGLIGFGNIAQRTADFAAPFGFRMIAYDPFLPESVFAGKKVEQVSFEELLSRSDVISIHTPLNEHTVHLIDKDTIAKMKDGVMLVNTSRGPIVNLEDLLNALKTEKIGYAALDVMETEPEPDVSKVFEMKDKIIATPHVAYNSQEAEETMMAVLADTAVTILNGGKTSNIVNAGQLGI